MLISYHITLKQPPSALTEDLPRAPPSIATASHPPSNCGAEIGARGSDNRYCHACGRGNPSDMSGENGDADSCDASTAAGGTDGVLDGAGSDGKHDVSGGQERSSHAAQVPAESKRPHGRMHGVSRAPAVLHGGQSRGASVASGGGTLASAGPRICVPDAEATGQYGRIVTEKPFRLFPNPVR